MEKNESCGNMSDKKGHKTTKKMQNEERVMMAGYKSGVAGVSIVAADGCVAIGAVM